MSEIPAAAALPPPGEQHFQIAAKAEAWLNALAEGNGLSARQVRLQRHDTSVHQLSGAVAVTLRPDISKTQKKGRSPQGLVLGSKEQVDAQAAGDAGAFLASETVRAALLRVLDGEKGHGWGLSGHKTPLPETAKEYSVVETCQKCGGNAAFACTDCQGTGRIQCQSCYGAGNAACTACGGGGSLQKADGPPAPCQKCGGGGRGSCAACDGRKVTPCRLCAATGTMGCVQCAMMGCWTNVYHAVQAATFAFAADTSGAPPEVTAALAALGAEALGANGQAEIFRQPPEARADGFSIPLLAYFPVAEAEFSINGKTFAAKIAGLEGVIVEGEPFLDPLVKPGITALLKISSGGGVAVAALLQTAMKYRVIAQALRLLPVRSKKAVYEDIRREYGAALSDKYARAIIKYGADALLAMGRAPRRKGLAAGTLCGAALSALWFLTPLRAVATGAMAARFVPFSDVGIWAAGYALAVLAIKYMAMTALRGMAGGGKTPLQPAGDEGLLALATTFVPWLALAFLAPARPDWAAAALKLAGF